MVETKQCGGRVVAYHKQMCLPSTNCLQIVWWVLTADCTIAYTSANPANANPATAAVGLQIVIVNSEHPDNAMLAVLKDRKHGAKVPLHALPAACIPGVLSILFIGESCVLPILFVSCCSTVSPVSRGQQPCRSSELILFLMIEIDALYLNAIFY